jgi:hypothetical protein
MNLTLRKAVLEDLDAVVAIYNSTIASRRTAVKRFKADPGRHFAGFILRDHQRAPVRVPQKFDPAQSRIGGFRCGGGHLQLDDCLTNGNG